jgi:elongator complex protein 2
VLEDGKPHQPMELLSASMDRNMMVWAPEEATARNGEGMWISKARVGEMGGNTLGFYGGVWGPKGEFMLAHGYNGSFHLWRRVSAEGDEWQPQVSVSGHFGAVEDIAWAPQGGYLMSASSDQTVRIFSRWTHSAHHTWHEIARPQIHGYDLSCIAFIPSALHKYSASFSLCHMLLSN